MLPLRTRAVARSAAFAASLAFSLVGTAALAQEAAPPLPPPAAAPMVAESAPREDALTVAGGYTCVVGEHAGIDRDDARTSADVLCHALASHGARPGIYDIRIGKLGGKLLLVVVILMRHGAMREVFAGTSENDSVGADV